MPDAYATYRIKHRWPRGLPSNKLTVKRNPSYWKEGADGKPLPYLDGFTQVIIADEGTRTSALRAGQLDFTDLLVDNLAQEILKSNSTLVDEKFPGNFSVMVRVKKTGETWKAEPVFDSTPSPIARPPLFPAIPQLPPRHLTRQGAFHASAFLPFHRRRRTRPDGASGSRQRAPVLPGSSRGAGCGNAETKKQWAVKTYNRLFSEKPGFCGAMLLKFSSL